MFEKIKKDLLALGNAKRAKSSARFFKTGKGQYGEGDKFVGIIMPEIRKIVKKYSKLDRKDVQKLFRSDIHEFRMAALLILVRQYEKGDEKTKKGIFDLYMNNTKHINNWDLVDVTTPHIVGDYLMNNDRSILYKLAQSNNLWERRISILATFTFIRNNDFNDTMQIATLLINDTHDLIHKAVGWMLREVGKRDENILKAFLEKHAHSMPRTMFRYATERLKNIHLSAAPQQM